MRARFLIPLFSVLLLLPAAGQDADGFSEVAPSEAPQLTRKQPSIWRRPARKTPAEQLAYAQTLEAKGRKRAATKQYRALVHRWHDTPEAVEAQLAYSHLLERRGKYRQAFDEYQYLVRFYPGRFKYDTVIERQFAMANQVMGTRHLGVVVFGGFEAPERALDMFEKIVANAPSWKNAPEALYRVGWIQEQVHEFEDAVSAYEGVLHRYPESDFVDAAGFRRAECLRELARRRPRDEFACREALSAVAAYLSRYASDEENMTKAEARMEELKGRLAKMYYDRAVFYDRAGRAKAALIAYTDFAKKFPADTLAGDAMARIEKLKDLTEQEDDEK